MTPRIPFGTADEAAVASVASSATWSGLLYLLCAALLTAGAGRFGTVMYAVAVPCVILGGASVFAGRSLRALVTTDGADGRHLIGGLTALRVVLVVKSVTFLAALVAGAVLLLAHAT